MDQNTLLILLTIFVAISAIALLIQGISLLGVFLAVRQLRTKVLGLWPEIEQIVGSAKRTAQGVEKNAEKIASTSLGILDMSKQQLGKVDDLLTDASSRAKVQME